MKPISELLQTQNVALKVLRSAGVDCGSYDIWLYECGGREKLSVLRESAYLPVTSDPQRYAAVLLEQMCELLAQASHEELLLAAQEHCESIYEAVMEVRQHSDSPGRNDGAHAANPFALAA